MSRVIVEQPGFGGGRGSKGRCPGTSVLPRLQDRRGTLVRLDASVFALREPIRIRDIMERDCGFAFFWKTACMSHTSAVDRAAQGYSATDTFEHGV